MSPNETVFLNISVQVVSHSPCVLHAHPSHTTIIVTTWQQSWKHTAMIRN